LAQAISSTNPVVAISSHSGLSYYAAQKCRRLRRQVVRQNSALVGKVSGRQSYFHDAWRQGLHMRVGSFYCPARLQPPHDRQPPPGWQRSAPLLILGYQLIGAQRNRDIEGPPNLHAKKGGGRDSDHWKRVAIQTDCSANDFSVPAEFALPESIAEHGTWAGAGRAIILSVERAAKDGLDPKMTKELAADI
jgi:hypothetical protein